MLDDLNDLYYFAKVVEHGGFAAAGRALHQPKWKRSFRSAGSRSSLARGIEGAIPVPLAIGASSS
jgi:hypothetical protein